MVTVWSVLQMCFRTFNGSSCLSFELISDTGVNTAPVCLKTQHKFHTFRNRETEWRCGQKRRPKSLFRKFIGTETPNDIESVGIKCFQNHLTPGVIRNMSLCKTGT